jgi:TatD DNase family protein
MIDCHCHLTAEEFNDDLDEVVDRAKKAGVEAVIVVGEFIDDQQKVLNICEKYPNFCFPALGLHPVQVKLI